MPTNSYAYDCEALSYMRDNAKGCRALAPNNLQIQPLAQQLTANRHLFLFIFHLFITSEVLAMSFNEYAVLSQNLSKHSWGLI